MNLLKSYRSAFYIFILSLILAPSGASIDITSNDEITSNNSTYYLTFEDKGELKGSVNVSYFFDSENVEKSEKPFKVTYDSGIAIGQSDVKNIQAVATNGTNTFSDDIEINVDRSKPVIDSSTLTSSKLPDGRINISWFSSDTGAGITKLKMNRTSSTGNYVAVKDIQPVQEVDQYLLDPNNKKIIEENFTYRLKVKDEAGNERLLDPFSVSPVDGNPPKIDSLTPKDGATINNQRTKHLRLETSDSISEIKSVSVEIEGIKNFTRKDFNSSSASVAIDISKLDDLTTYDVSIDILDDSDNKKSLDTTFTTDRTVDEINPVKSPDKKYITSETKIGVQVPSSDTSNIDQIKCIIDGEIYGKDTVPNDKDVYTCEEKLDPEDHPDSSVTFKINHTDPVGNSKIIKIGEYVINTEPPRVARLNLSHKTGDKPPDVGFKITSSGAKVSQAEYFIDKAGEKGSGNTVFVSGEEPSSSFRPVMAGAQSGEHSIYLRAKDRSGLWSETEKVDFKIFWDDIPQIEVKPSSIKIKSNETRNITLSVHNKGRVPLREGKLSFNENIEGESESFGLDPGGKKTIKIKVDAISSTGSYTEELMINSESIERNKDIKLIIEANKREIDEIDQRISALNQTVNELEQKNEEFVNSALNVTIKKNINSSIGRLNDIYRNLRTTQRSDKYYKASKKLTEASSVSKNLRDRIDEAERKLLIKSVRKSIFNSGLLVLAGGGLSAMILGLYFRRRIYSKILTLLPTELWR